MDEKDLAIGIKLARKVIHHQWRDILNDRKDIPARVVKKRKELCEEALRNFQIWQDEFGLSDTKREKVMILARMREIDAQAYIVATNERRVATLEFLKQEMDERGLIQSNEEFILQYEVCKVNLEAEIQIWEIGRRSLPMTSFSESILQKARDKVTREPVDYHTLEDLLQFFCKNLYHLP